MVTGTHNNTFLIYTSVLLRKKLDQRLESVCDPPYLIRRGPKESSTRQSQLDCVVSRAELGRRDVLRDRAQDIGIQESTMHDAFS